ncbi:MAG: nucleotidyl transferase AbiEii/AbiGii toxin family protein [Nitrospirota bacterium]
MLVGGLAVGIWVAPRATSDLDFVVGIDESRLPALAEAAEQAGFVIFDPKPVRFQRMMLFRMFLKEERDLLLIDCLLAGDDYTKQALSRTVQIAIAGHSVEVCAPEDLLLLKLVAARGLDLADAENVARFQHQRMDRSYLATWAERLAVSEALTQLMTNAASPDKPT